MSEESDEFVGGDVGDEVPAAAAGSSRSVAAGDSESVASSGGFQQLLQLASHLKAAQPEVREKREKWERLAFYQKNTVLWQKQDAPLRYAGVIGRTDDDDSFESLRLPRAQQWKAEATDSFKSGAYDQASMQYQRCVGLFQWARKYQTKDGDEIEWNDLLDRGSRSLDASHTAAATADVTIESAAAGDSGALDITLPVLPPSQHDRAQQLVFTCLINIAACEEKMAQWQHVIAVCEAALAMHWPLPQPSDQATSPAAPAAFLLTQLTVKALYRCAMANNKLDDLEKAIALLHRASKLAPKDAHIGRELASLRAQALVQREKDKTSFGGLFSRGEVFEGDQPHSAFSSARDLATVATPTVDTTEQTKQFMSDYLTGFRADAQKARASSTSAAPQRPPERPRRSASTTSSDNDSDDSDVDASFDTSAPPPFSLNPGAAVGPSPASLAAMYADARERFGLDLSDPLIQEELTRVQEEHRRTGKTHSERRKDAESATKRSGDATAPGPSDLASGGWLGPLLFCLILALALRWITIL